MNEFIFSNVAPCNFTKSYFPLQVFFNILNDKIESTYFPEHLQVAASVWSSLFIQFHGCYFICSSNENPRDFVFSLYYLKGQSCKHQIYAKMLVLTRVRTSESFTLIYFYVLQLFIPVCSNISP